MALRRRTNVGRPFDFKENGHGVVIHEARVDYETWSPVLQILRFTDDEHKGDIQFRFGYCDAAGTLIARPLYLDESQLADLGRAASREPEIRRMLRNLCVQLG
jgi:hypothetical protein